jgi:hypothetical protein
MIGIAFLVKRRSRSARHAARGAAAGADCGDDFERRKKRRPSESDGLPVLRTTVQLHHPSTRPVMAGSVDGSVLDDHGMTIVLNS